MKRTNTKTLPISIQMKERLERKPGQQEDEYEGDFNTVISTGSTLLDLAISGDRVRGGGLPGGIFVEVFGPSSSGKTVLLSEIAGAVQCQGGSVRFEDPEARLNTSFARMFGLSIEKEDYNSPDTVTEVFDNVRKWKPLSEEVINGIFVDSLAALSTDMEMKKEEGDPYGGRRAKEFSEGLRKTCRLIKNKNYLMVCSNQIRENISGFGPKDIAPGGKAVGFYSSLRLQFSNPTKLTVTKKIAGKERKRTIGVETEIIVYKSSISAPFRSATVTILFDYGIDDIRQNLQYIKDYTDCNTYTLGGKTLNNSMEKAIQMVEKENREEELRNEVINLWEEVENKFKSRRKKKKR